MGLGMSRLYAEMQADLNTQTDRSTAQMNPRRFRLIRDRDVTGASGTGHVADGVQWPDGTATVRWRGNRASTVHWDRVADAEAIHGHGGATRIEWIDPTT